MWGKKQLILVSLLLFYLSRIIVINADQNHISCLGNSNDVSNSCVTSKQLELFVQNIPVLPTHPLIYVFEHLKLRHKENTLWIVYGVYLASSLNYVATFTKEYVFGFDSFVGLPEDWREGFPKGTYSTNGAIPLLYPNAIPVDGPFFLTVPGTLQYQSKKISFIHMDCDLYNSTKYALEESKPYIDEGCIIVFGAFLKYEGFAGANGALRAFYEFVEENGIDFEWIGKEENGESVGVRIKSVPNQPDKYRSEEEMGRSRELTSILVDIPNLLVGPRYHVVLDLKLKQQPGTLWLEFGVFKGTSLNFIANSTDGLVYGFDTFEGLPEDWRNGFPKGSFSLNGSFPPVLPNVRLVKGLFQDTLLPFLFEHNDELISLIHIDCDLYSCAKFVLDSVKDRLAPDCVLIFDELVNYPGFDDDNGELRAWNEFIRENEVDYEWMGMDGIVGAFGYRLVSVGVILHSVAPLKDVITSPDQLEPVVEPNVTGRRRVKVPSSPTLLGLVRNLPDLQMTPLQYLFRIKQLQHIPNTLWLEFGVYEGKSISFIAKHTTERVYGFDSFHGLPENWRSGFPRGEFDRQGLLPEVPDNVVLIKGLFQDTLGSFLEAHAEPVSFLHIDSDLYSSAKYILDMLKDRLVADCVVIFDELVNYVGFDGENGELRAWYEFITENDVDYDWIGMKGRITFNNEGFNRQAVGLIIHSVKPRIMDNSAGSDFAVVQELSPREKRAAREALRYALRSVVENNIPDLQMHPLLYILEKQRFAHQPNTSWVLVGVYEGIFINTMAEFTTEFVYGLGHFYGLDEYWRPGYPEGAWSQNGQAPSLRSNVMIVGGEYREAMSYFLNEYPQRISLLYIHTMVYRLTKHVLDSVKERLSEDCVVIFNDLVNYVGYDGENGELRAWYEFIAENDVEYEWIGMEGRLYNNIDSDRRAVALKIHSIKSR